jgi:hypothetical protein
MRSTGKDTQPAQDGMPTTRGMNFYLEDRNLQFLCESVMDAETFVRARPHLVEMGEVAGGELDHLLAASLLQGEGQALRERSQDFRKLLVGALYVQRWLTPRDLHAPPFAARDIAWLDSLIAWTPIPKTALARP